MGPLPGNYVALTEKIIEGYGKFCSTDGHEAVLGVRALVVDSDSFGSDYAVLCEECCLAEAAETKQRNEEQLANPSNTCDWCKTKNVFTYRHRDIEEGSHGAVYDVCQTCINKELKQIRDDLEDSYLDI